jgi:hypothetical protein
MANDDARIGEGYCSRHAIESLQTLKVRVSEMIESACSVSYLTADPLADDLIKLISEYFRD